MTTVPASNPTPAGWRPDPEDATSLRYWDGTAWTDQRAPNPQHQTYVGTTAPPSRSLTNWGIALMVEA